MRTITNLLHRFPLSSDQIQRSSMIVATIWVLKSMLVAAKFGQTATAELSLEFVKSSQSLLHIALAACIYMVFVRRLLPLAMAGCAIMGTLANRWGWIDFHAHNFLHDLSLYPPLVETAPDGSINPQYAKLLLFGIFAPLLAYRVVQPSQRTLDRIFVLAAVGSILATSAVFHAVVPDGSLKQQKTDARHILAYATQLEGTDMERYCHYLAVHCRTVANPEEARALLHERGINAEMLGVTEDRLPGTLITGVAGSMQDMRFTIKGVAYRAPTEKAHGVLVIDDKHLQKTQYAAEIQFSFMAILAHGTWLLLAFGLSALHASKKRFVLSRPPRPVTEQAPH